MEDTQPENPDADGTPEIDYTGSYEVLSEAGIFLLSRYLQHRMGKPFISMSRTERIGFRILEEPMFLIRDSFRLHGTGAHVHREGAVSLCFLFRFPEVASL